MIVGLIGFGKVSQNLVKLIRSDDIKFISSKENRSKSTIEAIDDSNVETLPTFDEVAKRSDILISAASPKVALNIAKRYGKLLKGIYLDLNNIFSATNVAIFLQAVPLLLLWIWIVLKLSKAIIKLIKS